MILYFNVEKVPSSAVFIDDCEEQGRQIPVSVGNRQPGVVGTWWRSR